MSRLLKTYPNKVTNPFGNGHIGIDIVGADENWDSQVDTILAHSDGEVVEIQTGKVNNKGSKGLESYGNYVKIKHNGGAYTRYAHLEKVFVIKGQLVKQGQEIGYMGNTGNSYGSHLHFEVMDKNQRILNPTPYLEADLPTYYKYVGYLDTARLDGFTGWAWNSINDKALNVDIQIFKNNALIKTISTLANNYRSDLEKAKKGNGKHAFNVKFDMNTLGAGKYMIKAYTNGVQLVGVKYVTVQEKKVEKPVANKNNLTFKATDRGKAKVKIKIGAKYVSGKTPSPWVYARELYYRDTTEEGNIRVSTVPVGAITGTFAPKDIIKL